MLFIRPNQYCLRRGGEHTLEALRPLGKMQRARTQVYLQTKDFRQRQDGISPAEPGSNAEAPD